MSTTIQSVQLANGLRLPYVEHGDPDGIPVVMLHGYSDSLHSFDLLTPLLPAAIRALALTQRGHGDADKPASGYNPQQFASDLAAFLDALAIPSAIIVGHSMGSIVAQRFALDFPQRTRALVLIGAMVNIKHINGYDEFTSIIASLTDPLDPAFVREFQESTLARPVPPDFFETVIRESNKLPVPVWKAVMPGLIDDEQARRLSDISAPTLVIWGELDAIIPRSEQDGLFTTLPDARLSVYAGTGHAPHWEEPERVAAGLIEFVNQVVAR